MRIAMLAPINRRIPPRPYGPEEQLISDLVEGLVERGHEVVLFATGNSLTRAELVAVCPKPLVEWNEEMWPEPRWWEEMHISECMLQAARGEYDLVHNHLHAKALPFMAGLSTPVLTTLHGAGRDHQLHRILLRFKDFPFVAMGAEEREHLPELNYVADIAYPRDEDTAAVDVMVMSYEVVYMNLVSGKIPPPSLRWQRLLPWGRLELLLDSPEAQVRRLSLHPGQAINDTTPPGKRDSLTILAGQARLVRESPVDLIPGRALELPGGISFRLENPGNEPAVILRVQVKVG
jgi:mannose-6-phosphate isomerase-like protein (cupin superfamily)